MVGARQAVFVLSLALVALASGQAYREEWFTQTLDHFNAETKPATFHQRYLINDTYWDREEGVILFYTGNEGDITSFADNTGFMFDIAPKLRALLVFMEHRYYGKSLPFGDASLQRGNIGYLSVEQALADYAEFLTDFRTRHNVETQPVVAIGGSYGGMLAAWIRMRYPDVIDAALAASAPLLMAETVYENHYAFFETVTKDLASRHAQCPDLAREAYAEVERLRDSAEGRRELERVFRLCHPLNTESDVEHMILWSVNGFTSLAMMDYPYPTDFLAPLPAFPMNQACDALRAHEARGNILEGLAEASGLFYNGTSGALSCFDTHMEFISCADQTGCGVGNNGKAWDYQACTEVVYFMSTNNKTDMFPARKWTLDDLTAYCKRTWGVIPRAGWLAQQFGGRRIAYTSRIIFSNGALDPWKSGGFLPGRNSLGKDLVTLEIPSGAHHLDLRGATPEDPADVTRTREEELRYIMKWTAEARAERSRSYA